MRRKQKHTIVHIHINTHKIVSYHILITRIYICTRTETRTHHTHTRTETRTHHTHMHTETHTHIYDTLSRL